MNRVLLISLFIFTTHVFSGAESVINSKSDSTKAEDQRRSTRKLYDGKINSISGTMKNMFTENRPEHIRRTQNYIDNLNTDELPYTECNESMPEINLESNVLFEGSDKEGSLNGLPHDHQDGYSTCYANSAKNIMYGLSGGVYNASVFDTALQSQNHSLDGIHNGFNMGMTCDAFDIVKEHGACSNELSPLENGEAPPILEMLNKDKTDEEVLQSYYNIDMNSADSEDPSVQRKKTVSEASSRPNQILSQFLKNYSKFTAKDYAVHLTKVEKKLAKHLRQNISSYIDLVKDMPYSTTHLPIMEETFPDTNKLKGYLDKKNKKYSQEDIETVKALRAKFEWDIRKELSKKPIDMNIINQFKEDYTKTVGKVLKLRKNDLLSDDKFEQWLNGYKNNKRFMNANFVAVDNLSKLENHFGSEYQALINACADYQMDSYVDLIEDLKNLVLALDLYNIDPEVAINEAIVNGEFSPNKLMENFYMPGCSENRTKPELAYTCTSMSNKNFKRKPELLNKVILKSLLNNRPIGYDSYSHAMTMVGIRFNKETNSCEYLIRDSGYGTSRWEPYSAIEIELAALNIFEKD
jgi:hypothetical protein